MRSLSLFILLAGWLFAAQARPLFETLDGNQPVRLRSLQLRADIAAGMAQTMLRMEVYNPNPRQLEATLQLPLSAGQQVSAFALDIGGVLRPAVPVDKAKGQQVFEAIQRQRVDPALLEQTAGNNFRVRIYPVPGHGTRLVELTIIETLQQHQGQWHYRPPLQGVDGLAGVDVDFQVRSEGAPIASGTDGMRRLITVPVGAVPRMLVQSFGGERYFLAQVPVPASPEIKADMPRVLGLLWDASGSGAKRNHAAELATLGHYLRAIGKVEVRLVRLRDRAESPIVFRVEGGDWSALQRELQRTVYDGASALGGWTAQADVDAWLLVSDGLHNYGKPGRTGTTMHVLASLVGSDLERLQALASRHGGVVADLSGGLAPQQAAEMLLNGRTALPALVIEGGRDLLPDPAGAQQGWLRVAGRIAPGMRVLTLQTDGTRTELPLPAQDTPFAALTWARYKVQSLAADYDLNAAEIRRLGKEFSMPTRATSLIVLETLEDYIRHDILPPADMRAAFFQSRAHTARLRGNEEKARIDAVAAALADKVRWWNQRFEQTPPPPPPPRKSMAQMEPPKILSAPVAESMIVEAARPAPAVPLPAARAAVPVLDMAAPVSAAKPGAPAASTAIRLQAWTPNAPYLDKLRRTPTARLYAAYLEQKRHYPSSTAFFVDVADLLFERGQRTLGLRVLSNLAEMDLGNRHVLRVLGYRLIQAGEPGLAVLLFRKVQEMAPEEPQSMRDLGLAYAAAGQPQRAVDSLYEVVKGSWDDRFAEVELIALAELNAIVGKHKRLDTRAIDKRLLKNLSLDLRVVLGWDADNVDIDLSVTDPNGEECNYGHRATFQGGRMSDDFTGGYGPEEFSLRRAKPGVYKVHAHFYGHNQQTVVGPPTLQLQLQTGFGTARERRKTITLRLDGQGQKVFVGEFEVK